MPLKIDGKTFYRTHEALAQIGISRSTLFKWLREDRIPDAKRKDRRGWRLFTEQEIKKIKTFNESFTIIK